MCASLSVCFQFYQINNRNHEKTKLYTAINTFWVNQNNKSVLKNIEISTFDFLTLYKNIWHDKLLDILTKLIDFVFKVVLEIKFQPLLQRSAKINRNQLPFSLKPQLLMPQIF